MFGLEKQIFLSVSNEIGYHEMFLLCLSHIETTKVVINWLPDGWVEKEGTGKEEKQ